MVCSNSEYKLKKKLGSTKETRQTNEKSEIYEIQETVDIITLDKLGGKSRPDSRTLVTHEQRPN
jgi:hypothetical protein